MTGFDCSNRSSIVGLVVEVFSKREYPGLDFEFPTPSDEAKKPILRGKVVGYDSIGLLVEHEPGSMLLIQWKTLEGYKAVYKQQVEDKIRPQLDSDAADALMRELWGDD